MLAETISNSTGTEFVFWMSAIFATLFFFMRVALAIITGFGHDVDGNIYHDVDSAEGTEGAFKLLSLNSISAFIMMFGWVGLACLKQNQLGPGLSSVIAIIAGAASMVFTAYMFKWAMKLAAPGDEFSVDQTVGKNGTVYQKIPAEGLGKIQITINGLLRELSAISEEKKELNSFAHIVVVRTVDDRTVSVKPIN